MADSPGFLDGFTRNFFTADGVLKVSEEQRQAALAVALQAELNAASECIRSWTTDFTDDLARITVPTLVIHGDSDAIVPLEKSGLRTHEHVAGQRAARHRGRAARHQRLARRGVQRACCSTSSSAERSARVGEISGAPCGAGPDAGGSASMPASLRCSGVIGAGASVSGS